MSALGTGPPYPPPPRAGQNAIGVGQIGQKPIAQFTASISGTFMTVSAMAYGVIVNGYALADELANVLSSTTVVSQVSGVPGKTGVYNINPPQNIASETMLTFSSSAYSPVGDIPTLSVWDTILSQYANSPILMQLILNFFNYVDQTANMDAFFDLIWNVDTAQGYGLDVWGRIVGVSRIVQLEQGAYFGLEHLGGASGDPFNVSPFYNGETLTANYALTDASYRMLILAKALSNISDGSIKSINQILINLFPNQKNAFVVDNEDMTMSYTFDFVTTPVQQAIVTQSGVLPKPVGGAATFSFA